MTDAPDVLERTSPAQLDEGDHERLTHIVLEGFHPSEDQFVPTGNSVIEGMVNSTPVVALCGKTWVPGRDPGRYPICQTCAEIARGLGWRVPGS